MHVRVSEPGPAGAWLIAPRPFGHWDQQFERFAASGVTDLAEIGALNGGQRAYLMRADGQPTLSYTIVEAPAPAAPWVWAVDDNRHTLADAGLREQAAELCNGAPTKSARLRSIIEGARVLFSYGHGDSRFTDGHESVPALCGTTRGSCVDINTFVLAAARSQDITGQYIAGYWFGPGRTTTPDMHCWLAFDAGGLPEFWDVAHHLKWGVEGFGPGLNPAGGRRVAMSCGRGLCFEGPFGPVEISHFSEPLWLTPDGASGAAIRIELEEKTE